MGGNRVEWERRRVMGAGQGRGENGAPGSGGDGPSGRPTRVVVRGKTCAASSRPVLLGIELYACLAPVVEMS